MCYFLGASVMGFGQMRLAFWRRAGLLSCIRHRFHSPIMSAQPTIRNVPQDARDDLARRAAANVQSMRECLRVGLARLALA